MKVKGYYGLSIRKLCKMYKLHKCIYAVDSSNPHNYGMEVVRILDFCGYQVIASFTLLKQ